MHTGARQLVVMSEAELYRQLGRKVATRRKEIGLSQAQVAAQLGLTRASLANLETGRQRLMLHHLYRLVRALRWQTILDLVPDNWVFEDPPIPVKIKNDKISLEARAGVEQLLRSALAEPGRSRPS
jgi:transcriptional regulator with XRE-family HTH domain